MKKSSKETRCLPENQTVNLHRLHKDANHLTEDLRMSILHNKVFELRELGNFYSSDGDYKLALNHYAEGCIIAQKVGDKKLEAGFCMAIAECHLKLEQYADAMKNAEQAVDRSFKCGDMKLKALSHYILGLTLAHMQEFKFYEQAISCCKKAISLFKELGSGQDRHLGDCYFFLSQSYKLLSKQCDALCYQKKHLRITMKIGNQEYEAYSLINMSSSYMELNDVKKALVVGRKAAEISNQIGNKFLQEKCFSNIGNICEQLEQFDKAIQYYGECLKIAEETGDTFAQATANLCLGGCLRKSRLFEEAVERNDECFRIAKEQNYVDLFPTIYICKAISMHFGKKDFHSARGLLEECLKLPSINIEKKGDALKSLGKVYRSLAYREKNSSEELYQTYMEKAEINLRKAIDCHDYQFKHLQDRDDFKVSISSIFVETYRLLVNVLIDTGQTKEALLISDRSRGRGLKDTLIRQYSRSQNPSLTTTPITYAEVEGILSNDDFCILHFSVLQERLAVWVLSKDSMKFSESFKSQFIPGEEMHDYQSYPFFKDTVIKLQNLMNSGRSLRCENRSLDDLFD